MFVLTSLRQSLKFDMGQTGNISLHLDSYLLCYSFYSVSDDTVVFWSNLNQNYWKK